MAVATHREGMRGGVYVFSPGVAGAMGLDSPADGVIGPQAVNELARALGRVVVHEVVHVLAPYHPQALSRIRLPRQSALLLVSESHHRIDSGGTKRRYEAGSERYGDEKHRYSDIG